MGGEKGRQSWRVVGGKPPEGQGGCVCSWGASSLGGIHHCPGVPRAGGFSPVGSGDSGPRNLVRQGRSFEDLCCLTLSIQLEISFSFLTQMPQKWSTPRALFPKPVCVLDVGYGGPGSLKTGMSSRSE